MKLSKIKCLQQRTSFGRSKNFTHRTYSVCCKAEKALKSKNVVSTELKLISVHETTKISISLRNKEVLTEVH